MERVIVTFYSSYTTTHFRTLKKTVSGNRKTVSNTLSMRYSYSMDIKDSQGLFRVAL